ncbi:uncharacterized protein PITG_15346 [Phytophthora infestans T30-4]|uniref:Uncharacterized protein n=1 Tax=Phytophthora infestans (strain T30-4) TaxID=403677 RepID=D0NQH4_PHYIT|nr:uncharacterized protein PITG_15346 [Phytophthora infestans T30-4]EEY62906.1 hypothetical protein PITG_15346 [Phytophthora infestans T30-4]|eukprot:XP_002898781.1 hypothetical protein PITG_15346 [Phytophthora infestans T30-4]
MEVVKWEIGEDSPETTMQPNRAVCTRIFAGPMRRDEATMAEPELPLVRCPLQNKPNILNGYEHSLYLKNGQSEMKIVGDPSASECETIEIELTLKSAKKKAD